MNTRHLKSKQGFTLIELLVVIAIIGLLASLLMPALSNAKRKAQGVKCMNNLHQIGVSLSVYVDDNKDRLPFCAGLLPSGDTNLPPIMPVLKNYGATRDIFRCPEDRKIFDKEGTSYEWNKYFNGAPYLHPSGKGELQTTIVQIYQGRQATPLMGDADAFHGVHSDWIGRYALYFEGRVDKYKLPLPLTLMSTNP